MDGLPVVPEALFPHGPKKKGTASISQTFGEFNENFAQVRPGFACRLVFGGRRRALHPSPHVPASENPSARPRETSNGFAPPGFRLSGADLGLRGLSLQGLEVSEEPDFKAGTVLKAQALRVRPRLMALLQRRIELADVLLSDWECDVTHRADGTWNVESSQVLLKLRQRFKPLPAVLGASTAPGAAGGALAAAWQVDRVRLENGAVRYTDNATRAAYTLKNIQISTKHLKPEGAFPVNLSMDYSGQGLEGRIELRGSADLGGLHPPR